MAHPDPDRRRQIASLAAHTSWARTPHREERLAPANRAREAKWEREVDPDGVMDPATRAKAAASARTAFYKQIALKSVQARRARAEAKRAA